MQLRFKPNPKQLIAIHKWIDPTTTELLYGGAKYGGKSFLGANLIFCDALTYPETHYFIAREELVDLRKYTIPTIDEVFKKWGIVKDDFCRYNGQDNYYQLYNGSRVYLLACAYIPSDPLFERFGSMQMTRGWIEEGGEVHTLAYENLNASLGRKMNREHNLKRKLLITCNPKKNWMYRLFYKPWAEGSLPEDKAFIQALAEDNIYGDQDYVTGNLAKMKDKVMRERLYHGNWEYNNDPANLVEFDKIGQLFTNTHILPGQPYITADIARFGRDMSVICVWSGLQCIYIETIDKSKITVVADRILELQKRYQVPASQVIVDEDGVGGGVMDILSCEGFVNNSSAIGDDNFDNLKSQCYFKLADYINSNMLFINTKDELIIERLSEELDIIRQKAVDNDKKKGVIRKDKMKELINRSPDISDAIMMRMYFELETGPKDYSW